MSESALEALRTYLRSIDGVDAFCLSRYGRAPKYLIGYTKPTNQLDWPFIACTETLSVTGAMDGNRVFVSIILGVIEKGINDQDVYDGVASLWALTQLIRPALLAGHIGEQLTLVSTLRELPELTGHPYYQRELQLILVSRSA